MRPGDDDFDPWSETTPSVDDVRDDPFDSWPTGSAMSEATGPNGSEGLIARAAWGRELPHRRSAARGAGIVLLTLLMASVVWQMVLFG